MIWTDVRGACCAIDGCQCPSSSEWLWGQKSNDGIPAYGARTVCDGVVRGVIQDV